MNHDNLITQAEAELHQREKSFLMEKYTSQLLLQLDVDEEVEKDLDNQTVNSLLVARSYVSGELATQIVKILESNRHDVEKLKGQGVQEEKSGSAIFNEDEGTDRVAANEPETKGEIFDEGSIEKNNYGLVDEENEGIDAETRDDEVAGLDDKRDLHEPTMDGDALDVERSHQDDEEEGLFDDDKFSPTKKEGFSKVDTEEEETDPISEKNEKGGPIFDQNIDVGIENPRAAESKVESVKKTPIAGAAQEEKDQFLSPWEKARNFKQQQKKAGAVPEMEEGLDLDVLAHQVSLEDLEQYLGMTAIPDDRVRLQQRWIQKVRDSSLKEFLGALKVTGQPYALIPRLARYSKSGQPMKNTLLNLLHCFPQLFDNVTQILNKYKTERFFATEVPEADWAIVACEALPESRNKSFKEQRHVIRSYSASYHADEPQIQRRSIVEAVYDVIVINAITGENILSQTVDITSTSASRQNLACTNMGKNGIRLTGISQQQKHASMGICPSW